MTPDLDAICARHHRISEKRGYACQGCGQPWGESGCDTRIVLAALEEANALHAIEAAILEKERW